MVVIDCTVMGAFPPTGTSPTSICRVFFRFIDEVVSIVYILEGYWVSYVEIDSGNAYSDQHKDHYIGQR